MGRPDSVSMMERGQLATRETTGVISKFNLINGCFSEIDQLVKSNLSDDRCRKIFCFIPTFPKNLIHSQFWFSFGCNILFSKFYISI